MTLIVKNNIRKVVKELQRTRSSQSSVLTQSAELDKENTVSNVAEEVGPELEKKVEEILANAIKRAKANGRRTIQARDL